jgi:uncharacterized membrane protein YdjX (TVP38/TMEM64 family)
MRRKLSFKQRLIVVITVIVVVLLTPYFLWHEQMDAYFASPEYQRWLVSVRPYAWLIGIGLIVGDLVLPVPTPPVMATLGALYGAIGGGLISAAGSVLAGLTAYGTARLLGKRGSRLLATDEELSRFRRFFESWGTAGIIASRALPILPEVLTLLAGLAGMNLGKFTLALVAGSLPVGFLVAWAGDAAGFSSTLLLVLTLVPAALWVVYVLLASRLSGRRNEPAAAAAAIEGDAV